MYLNGKKFSTPHIKMMMNLSLRNQITISHIVLTTTSDNNNPEKWYIQRPCSFFINNTLHDLKTVKYYRIYCFISVYLTPLKNEHLQWQAWWVENETLSYGVNIMSITYVHTYKSSNRFSNKTKCNCNCTIRNYVRHRLSKKFNDFLGGNIFSQFLSNCIFWLIKQLVFQKLSEN